MIEHILSHPVFTDRLLCSLKKDVYQKIGEFSAKIHLSHEPIPPADFDKIKYEDISVGKKWTTEKFDCAVFKLSASVPAPLV